MGGRDVWLGPASRSDAFSNYFIFIGGGACELCAVLGWRNGVSILLFKLVTLCLR